MIEPIKIEDTKAIEVYSVRHVGDYLNIGEAYKILMKFAYTQKIKHKKNLMGKDAKTYGIAYDDPKITPVDKLRSDACISADDEVDLPYGIQKQTIDGGKHAVFLHKGSYELLKNTYAGIYQWVKDNDIDIKELPTYECYHNRDPRRTKPENLRTEIFLPIK